MDISARALLVNTTVRVWTGEKRDRAITREICTMKGAEDNAVRANKSLLGEHIHDLSAIRGVCVHRGEQRLRGVPLATHLRDFALGVAYLRDVLLQRLVSHHQGHRSRPGAPRWKRRAPLRHIDGVSRL